MEIILTPNLHFQVQAYFHNLLFAKIIMIYSFYQMQQVLRKLWPSQVPRFLERSSSKLLAPLLGHKF